MTVKDNAFFNQSALESLPIKLIEHFFFLKLNISEAEVGEYAFGAPCNLFNNRNIPKLLLSKFSSQKDPSKDM